MFHLRRRIYVVRILRDLREIPFLDRESQKLVVYVAELSKVFYRYFRCRSIDKLLYKQPEFFAKLNVRGYLLHRLRVDARLVNSVADCAAAQGVGNHLGYFDSAAFLRLFCRSSQVRGQYEIREFQERAVFRERLRFVNVETCRCDFAAFERLHKRAFFNDAAAGAVEYAHTFFHHFKSLFVQHIFGGFGKRHMDRYVVGALKCFFKRHHFYTYGFCAGLS